MRNNIEYTHSFYSILAYLILLILEQSVCISIYKGITHLATLGTFVSLFFVLYFLFCQFIFIYHLIEALPHFETCKLLTCNACNQLVATICCSCCCKLAIAGCCCSCCCWAIKVALPCRFPFYIFRMLYAKKVTNPLCI